MFGIGYSKYASGTVASFVTCIIFYSLYSIGYLESRGIQFLFEEDAVGVKLNK